MKINIFFFNLLTTSEVGVELWRGSAGHQFGKDDGPWAPWPCPVFMAAGYRRSSSLSLVHLGLPMRFRGTRFLWWIDRRLYRRQWPSRIARPPDHHERRRKNAHEYELRTTSAENKIYTTRRFRREKNFDFDFDFFLFLMKYGRTRRM